LVSVVAAAVLSVSRVSDVPAPLVIVVVVVVIVLAFSNSSNNAPLFVEDPELKVGNTIPTVVVAEEKAKLATEEQERQQVYEAWLTSKDEAKRAKAEQNKKLKKKSIHKKKAMKQKSNQAVNQWNKTRKSRKVTRRFRQQKAWEDVVAPANEVDLDVDDM
jgi:hypothetical protein|tara:strand:- start:759 stop:1238 length:480 start_codon:yes stop_codon:yes gene_type:complete